MLFQDFFIQFKIVSNGEDDPVMNLGESQSNGQLQSSQASCFIKWPLGKFFLYF